MSNKLLYCVKFHDLDLFTGKIENVADWIIEQVSSPKTSSLIISHINVNNFFHLQRNDEIKEKLKQNNCCLLFDGIGCKVGACLLGQGWHPDLNGTDLFPLVMKRASYLPLKLFFLGAKKPVIKQAVMKTRTQFPQVDIVGYYTGYYSSDKEDEIISQINKSGAHILLVGRGFILQEDFALRNQSRIKVRLIWNVGGLFDFISGNKPRAPKIMRKLRLEWFFRFLIEPGRMFHRYFIIPLFILWDILRLKYKRH